MRIGRMLLRLIGFELLAQELIKLMIRGAYNFREDIKKKLAALAIKGAVLLVVIGLLQCALFLGVAALALYLGTVLGGSYQGFLAVAGGCIGLSLVLLLVSRPWR